MFLSIRTVDDLIRILRSNDDIRRQVKQALFPGIDLESALQELIELNKRHDERLTRVEKTLEEMQAANAQRAKQVDKRFEQIDKRFDRLEHDVNFMKGKLFETEYAIKAASIFGSFLRRGRDGTNDVADRLYDMIDQGSVTIEDIDQVLAADLIWQGKARADGNDLVMIVEASWLAELNDVQRAAERAEIVRRVGLRALGVVAGVSGWTDEAHQAAERLHVVIANNRRVERESFTDALTAVET